VACLRRWSRPQIEQLWYLSRSLPSPFDLAHSSAHVHLEGCQSRLPKATRDLLYESRQDDVISGLDDLDIIGCFAQGAFDNGEDRSLVGINNDRSFNEFVEVGKEDP